jgi:hypothetical protein
VTGFSLGGRRLSGLGCGVVFLFAVAGDPPRVGAPDEPPKPLQEPPPPEAVSTPPPQAVQGLTIDHQKVGCVVAERFPVISARLDPAATVGRVRVFFRAAGGPHWYFVEMKAEGEQYVGALPKPKKSTPKIEYYIEALSMTLAPTRTPEYAPEVVPPPGACGKGRVLAVAMASAKLVVGAAAGAPAVPLGFSAAGLVSVAGGTAGGAVGASSAGGGAGGGLSTGLIVGIVGAGAAAATVAAAAGGSKSTPAPSPSTTQPPMTTPTPPTTAPPTDLTGHWAGTGADGFLMIDRQPGQPDCTVNLDISLDLSQSGSAVTGTGVGTVRGGTCSFSDPSRQGTVSGSASGSAVTMVINLPPPAPGKSAITFNLSGTVAANRMTGTLTGTSTKGETFTGTWALNRQ